MRYTINGADGQVYGPAEIDEINQWIVEGRVLPTTLLQPEGSTMRVAASTIPNLTWAQGQTFSAFTPQVLSTARYELAGSWICLAASVVLCCLPFGVHISLGVGGIILSVLAYRKGRTVAVAALILNLIVVLGFLWVRQTAGSGFDPQELQRRLQSLSR